nr:unnamed protein product [Callosobruchus chinensis]
MDNDNMPFSERFSIGDRLLLQLNTCEIFEGDYCGGGKNFIELTNGTQHNNPNKLKGTYSFDRLEIDAIRLLGGKASEKVPEKTIIPHPAAHKRIKIEEEEYERLKLMADNYIYLEHADNIYFESVEKLRNAETIGVICLGLEDRMASIRLLVLSTWQQVFLFDMKNFKNSYFYPEIKEILESSYVCKVMHKAGPMLDKLLRKYKVFVRNVFDTQVVDLVIEKNKTGVCPEKSRTVSECLVHYLNFPRWFLKSASETSAKKWLEQPLTSKRRNYAAQLVTYLIILKEEMQKTLLSEIHRAIDNVHDYYASLNNKEFADHTYGNVVTKEIDSLIPLIEKPLIQNDIKNYIINKIFDTIIVPLETRFADLSVLQFFDLINFDNFSTFSKEFPNSALDILIEQYPIFDHISLKNELSLDKDLLGEAKCAIDMLLFIFNNNLKSCLPELYKLLSLVLSIPVTSASVFYVISRSFIYFLYGFHEHIVIFYVFVISSFIYVLYNEQHEATLKDLKKKHCEEVAALKDEIKRLKAEKSGERI